MGLGVRHRVDLRLGVGWWISLWVGWRVVLEVWGMRLRVGVWVGVWRGMRRHQEVVRNGGNRGVLGLSLC